MRRNSVQGTVTDEKHDVGVVEFGQKCHLRSELEHTPLIYLLLDKPFYCYIHSFPSASKNDAIGAQANLNIEMA